MDIPTIRRDLKNSGDKHLIMVEELLSNNQLLRLKELINLSDKKPSLEEVEKKIAGLEQRLDVLSRSDTSGPYSVLLRGVRQTLDAAYLEQAKLKAEGGG
jgi:hypothetical protein